MSKGLSLINLTKTAVSKSKPAIKSFIYYAKVELVPPKISDFPAIRNDIKKLCCAAKNKRYLDLSVREVWLNSLVTIEVLCWFFIGECIGKRHVIGYKV